MEIYRAIEKCNYRKIFPKDWQKKIDKAPTGWECTRRFLNKLITWEQEEGWNATAFIFTMWSLFCHFGIFWRLTFSVTAPIRHLGSTRTENMGLQNLAVSRRHLNCLSSGKCSESLHKPQTWSCGTPWVSHLPIKTHPTELEGAELEPTEEGEHRSQLSAGCLVPRDFHIIFTYLHLLSRRAAGPSGPPWLCHTVSWEWALLWRQWFPVDFPVLSVRGFPGIFHGFPGAMCEGIPRDFSWTSWCHVWDMSDVSDGKGIT